MSQIRESIPATSIRRTRFGRLHPAATLTMAFVIAFVLGAGVGAGLRGLTLSEAAPRAIQGEVTDGWMSSIASVHAARRGAVTTDGWASRHLPSARGAAATDGWASRYLPSAAADYATDGWASRYLPSAQDD